jgi:hypothetical protein
MRMTDPVSAWINGVEVPLLDGLGRLGGMELQLHGSDVAGGARWGWSLRNAGSAPETVDRVGLRLAATPELVLEHGWQSWSPVRSCCASDARPSRRADPRWVSRMLLAEGDAAGASVRGDQFLVSDLGVAGSPGGAHNLTTIECHGRTPGLTAWALLDGYLYFPVGRSSSTLSGSPTATPVGSTPPTPASGARPQARVGTRLRSRVGALGISTWLRLRSESSCLPMSLGRSITAASIDAADDAGGTVPPSIASWSRPTSARIPRFSTSAAAAPIF